MAGCVHKDTFISLHWIEIHRPSARSSPNGTRSIYCTFCSAECVGLCISVKIVVCRYSMYHPRPGKVVVCSQTYRMLFQVPSFHPSIHSSSFLPILPFPHFSHSVFPASGLLTTSLTCRNPSLSVDGLHVEVIAGL